MHQLYVNLNFLCYTDSELSVVKLVVVGAKLTVDSCCFIAIYRWRIWTTSWIPPIYSELKTVAIQLEIFCRHTLGCSSCTSHRISSTKCYRLRKHSWVLLWVLSSRPMLQIHQRIFLSILHIPRISYFDELDFEGQSDVENTVSMIILNSLISHTFFRISILVYNLLGSSEQVSLLIVLYKFLL